jgi:two-component system phosphate regulon response regulator PhoB
MKTGVPTVLVVDDDVIIARVFARALTGEGYRVRTSHDAEDALRQIHEEPPDAIAVDFRMPRINGVGFLYRLRERPASRDIPVMMITADMTVSDDTRSELRSLGAELYLKPLSLEALLTAVRHLLMSHDGRQLPAHTG